MMVIQEKRCAH